MQPLNLKLTTGKIFAGLIERLRNWFSARRRSRSARDEEPPLRAELFSADQMEQYGRVLATRHQLADRPTPDRLLARLSANEIALSGVCELLTAAVTGKLRITPAGEWLLDNFYLIEEHIRAAKRHLPKGYSHELPRLKHMRSGSSAGCPRVYDIALEAVAHGDGRVDADSLSRFVAAYQTVTVLRLGELWAIPIMLRLAVIENLRRVGVLIANGWAERNLADTWADRMIHVAESDPKSLILVIADMARSDPPMAGAFVAELARRLHGRGPALVLPLTWIEQRLGESGLTIEQLVNAENQQQATDQVSVSNSIGSLRVLAAMDWRTFVERMSSVDQTLLQDPGGVYGRMDFATRDVYRHATEEMAKLGRLDEVSVARQAIEMARAAAAAGGEERAAHVGYYLIDKGRPALEQVAEVRQPLPKAIRRAAVQHPLLLYLGTIALITAIVTGCLLAQALEFGIDDYALLPIGILTVLAASQLAAALANWLATELVTPRSLPRMDFSEGIAAASRTLVVVPTMLTSASEIDELVEALEVRFLANRDDHLYFGLLTDFRDSGEASLPEDGALVEAAKSRVDELNAKYRRGAGNDDRFFLFHRPRLWNPQQGIWMGYERKRGKLAALNALLRGRSGDDFSLVVGDTAVLHDVKYVITLDTDTQLPRDAARQIVGTMAHPLNQPHFDAANRCVIDGYGILQPRVAISLPGSNRSRYAQLYGRDAGIDPYTRAVSDVYQDLFGEGSFIGKGIYDVDAFEQALGGCFPANRILSHDLIEGCYARAGLLSDVQLVEVYPARYGSDVSRRQRWIRGDWQLARWLRGRVPDDCGQWQANPLSLLSQWKLFDNLRRSLVPAALTVLLLLGWTLLSAAWWWTLSIIGVLVFPSLCALFTAVWRKPEEMLLRQHLAAVMDSAGLRLAQVVFELACLPYEACFSLDAIARTTWRMLVSRRRLLEWNPSSETDRTSVGKRADSLAASFSTMWVAPTIAAAVGIDLTLLAPGALLVAGPILLLWLLSPALAWWISRPLTHRPAELTVAQLNFLRSLSRRTWAFFDTLVGAEDHWLPPDNYQEYRVAAVAHRTSPTNIGLTLLANLAAYDFGYITAGRFIERTTNTLRTMAGLDRYRGHFYNWYDTQPLQPLPPLYVSTVDSGNLAGHLLTLRAGLAELADDRLFGARLVAGLQDTLSILAGVAGRATMEQVAEFAREVDSLSAFLPNTLATAQSTLERLAIKAAELVTQAAAGSPAGHGPEAESQAVEWAQALSRQCREALDDLAFLAAGATMSTIPTLRELANAGCSRARERLTTLERLAVQADDLARMDYDFLFDKPRHLLTIGYNVGEHRADAGYYDLLASEARLCNFVAIAQGQLPQASWFALGRLLTVSSGAPVLLSWSGSMFEYLMPLLVMPSYENTLLDQTCKAAVARQIEYGQQRGVPWGMSESAYNVVDGHLNYQYRAFGVPGLGLKRGLADDLVVAPYASALALAVAPEAACANLERLAADGILGKFGFFEAVDYTPSRQRRGHLRTIVRAFMAHHQGMSLLALANLLLARPMQRRFESDAEFKAVMLLLQERIPKATALYSHTAQLSAVRSAWTAVETPIRAFTSPDTPTPEVQLLSNGRYHVMVTNAGGGYSCWKDLAVTRWREDSTCDNWGSFCYIRDRASGTFWSSAHQPTLRRAESFEAIFVEGRAEFRRRDAIGNGIFETHTEIVVSPEDDVELRRVHIINRSRHRREIDVTSYAEVVIATPAADALHPAFSNLFVQTQILRERQAVLSTRRPRSLSEQAPWMLHLMVAHDAEVGEVSYETDRLRFIGRGRSTVDPAAMSSSAALSDSDGSVLDPIVAIRCSLTLDPEQSVTIDMVTGIAETRDMAVGLIDKFQDRHLLDRVFDLSWTHSQVVLRQINASEADAQLYARLASSVIYANPDLRAEAAELIKNRRGQSGLWGYAISGDLPIVLLRMGAATNIDLVRQLVQAHAYWRLKGLAVDLVIWNEEHSNYRQRLQDQIIGLIASGIEANVIDRPGGIFVRIAEQIPGEDRILLESVARAIITDSQGSLAEQLDQRRIAEPLPPRLKPNRAQRLDPSAPPTPSERELILGNTLGGFTRDGREYVITLAVGQMTPAPWVNVMANASFGTIVSESGSAYTWSENAHEFRLTPWYNDPVNDASGEAIYLRDEETGIVWSPTPGPVRTAIPFVVRHGFGYSVFESRYADIDVELWIYVAVDAAVKFSVLKVRNTSSRSRRLSATGYVEWVLADLPAKSAMHLSTGINAEDGVLYARNPYSADFPEHVAFFDTDDRTLNVTGDRREFIGRNGTRKDPAAMSRLSLSGKVGAGLDPCAAMQVNFDLMAGEEREIVFRLGVGRTFDEAMQVSRRFRGTAAARGALEAVWQYWKHTLGAVQVETPDPSVNVLTNGWLLYQTLACRLWARSGFYQSGGAFGFRDQLQDVMALVHAEPRLVREHLLLSASRQFLEGDVQHWWHPPSGRGVRTHCSDDYLWLPLAVCRYVGATHDTGVLDESVAFLDGRAVNPTDDSYYDLPGRSAESASLYEHCVRAIRHGLRFGERGLPLMGSGDWNDGMNLVGMQGRGESVWLGFFLCHVLRQFVAVAELHGDADFAALCRLEGTRLRQSIEQHGWDGAWYLRAYFDDGTPLGSANNAECQIDSIPQSWSVLSGASDEARSRLAMKAVDERLVRRDASLIQLLAPPFDDSALDPGYIRGYVPGVRENGGQYTHGAVWAAMAFAALGDPERAWRLTNMIIPVNHALSEQAIATYKVEPYVVTADVYATPSHLGRGGWSWYTGSAGWMYRLLLESLLGLRLEGENLHFAPCLPTDWQAFKIHYRYRETVYHITFAQIRRLDEQAGIASVTVDGLDQHDRTVHLVDDHQEHSIAVVVFAP